RGGDHRRRDVLRIHLRGVDGDVGNAARFEPGQQLLPYVLLEPGAMAELGQHPVAAELRTRPLEVVERGSLPDDVGRELEEDAAELAARPQWLERLEELTK